ncbi:MAG: N-acetylglucosamine-6-phosphate deacetylase [Anaerolineae bacterium]|nr:N-acetylglucosamine-6-phosphate deacetylase [Anaerolineae bacterium]
MKLQRWALVNGRVVLPDAVTQDKAVVVEGEKILAVVDERALDPHVEKIDVGGRFITPGLIDIHTHGALGHTFNEPTADAFETICVENARRGVTALVATLATAPLPDLVACLNFAREWMRAPRAGARVLGVYLESPYINPAQKGALDPANLRMPDDGSADVLLEHSDVIKIFALAPELSGALALVEKLARRGIVPAVGHSSAYDEHVFAAMRVGLRHVTHIWSAMSMTIREGPWRKPGIVETALLDDHLTVEMICDNKHLPPTLMKLAYKCIGANRLCVISDATSGAGLPEGARFKMGAMEYEVHDGVGMMLDRSAFAGSTTLLNAMIPILTNIVGVPLAETIRMMTLTPARVLGIDARVGSIAPGKDADLAIFDDDWRAWRVMIGGKWVANDE